MLEKAGASIKKVCNELALEENQYLWLALNFLRQSVMGFSKI
jgi:hypothetical protein